MTVISQLSAGYPGNLTQTQPARHQHLPDRRHPAPSRTTGSIYVDQRRHRLSPGPIPFDGYQATNPLLLGTYGPRPRSSQLSQLLLRRHPTPTPRGTPSSSDATTNGGLSGHLTVGANNDVIIDGPITYNDCTWAGHGVREHVQLQQRHRYHTQRHPGPDRQQLRRDQPPVDNNQRSCQLQDNACPLCTGGDLARPAVRPGHHHGRSHRAPGPDRRRHRPGPQPVLRRQQLRRLTGGPDEGTLTVYGSIQQDARGPVGTSVGGNNGYSKYYTGPRLTLYGPPYYLTPGTPSWALDSSAESYTGTEPSCPPPSPPRRPPP